MYVGGGGVRKQKVQLVPPAPLVCRCFGKGDINLLWAVILSVTMCRLWTGQSSPPPRVLLFWPRRGSGLTSNASLGSPVPMDVGVATTFVRVGVGAHCTALALGVCVNTALGCVAERRYQACIGHRLRQLTQIRFDSGYGEQTEPDRVIIRCRC